MILKTRMKATHLEKIAPNAFSDKHRSSNRLEEVPYKMCLIKVCLLGTALCFTLISLATVTSMHTLRRRQRCLLTIQPRRTSRRREL